MSENRLQGIVRSAKRPPGWYAPGPPPAVPWDRPDVWPAAGEDLCYLAGDWRILQRVRGHRWSLDDLVTAWFAVEQTSAMPASRILDLGCGIGAVLLLLAWSFPRARCVGIEAQELSVDMARRSLAWNGAADRCEVRCGDLRDPAVIPEAGTYDLVTGTPPYLSPGSAIEPRRIQQAPCHIEQRGGIDAYCLAAARLMAPGACFVACHSSPQRLGTAARAAGLAIAAQRDVIPRQGKAALFSVYEMRRADDIASSNTLPPLIVRDAGGRRTHEFIAVRQKMGMPP